MKVLSRNKISDWTSGGEKLTPIDGFFSIFEPIERIDDYRFETWEELINTLSNKDIVVSKNGYKTRRGEMFILIKDNQILGCASVHPQSGNRVQLDSNHALTE
ncbi:MAG: hypothetical protein GY797_28135 [Deltaproteobacteria bacterium]|nr:hypothetical protein [Deltaproteobacteria bacterium]